MPDFATLLRDAGFTRVGFARLLAEQDGICTKQRSMEVTIGRWCQGERTTTTGFAAARALLTIIAKARSSSAS